MSPPTLRATGLRYQHPGTSEAVFDNVSLEVRPREIVALLGGSGCGKSTLLRLLAGLTTNSKGDIQFLEQTVRAPHPRSAVVFQQASLLPWLDVQGNVGFGLDFKHQTKLTAAEKKRRIATAIEAVGLHGHARTAASALSGGMAQRVSLARALARQPALLFADEPFSALDAVTRAEMQTLLVDVVHQWQTAVLLVTHDIEEAIQVADRIILMGHPVSGPAQLVRTWSVEGAHPRDIHSPSSHALRLDILQALQQVRKSQPTHAGAMA